MGAAEQAVRRCAVGPGAAAGLPIGIVVLGDVHVVDVGDDLLVQLAAQLHGVPGEHHDIDGHVVFQQEAGDLIHGHLQRLGLGIAVDAGGDQREGHRFAVVLLRQRQGAAIAGRQQLALAVRAALPDGADGVDHVLAGQVVSPGDLGLAGFAAVQRAALLQQPRAGGAVDGAVHAPAAQQRLVGGVDDGVNLHAGDVISHDFQRHGNPPQMVKKDYLSNPLYHIGGKWQGQGCKTPLPDERGASVDSVT